jgi:group I intron endonuclease
VFGIIYKATGPSGLVYIGQTTRPLKRRIADHKFQALKGDRRKPVHVALLALGFSSFTWEQIDEAETAAELDVKERYWIKHYQSDNTAHGYNGTDGGEKTTYSPETKRRISEALKGRIISDEQRRKQSATMKGRKFTPGNRRKISAALKGIKRSPETCWKMSQGQKGRVVTEATRKKIRAIHKGRTLSEKHRLKISEALKRFHTSKSVKQE